MRRRRPPREHGTLRFGIEGRPTLLPWARARRAAGELDDGLILFRNAGEMIGFTTSSEAAASTPSTLTSGQWELIDAIADWRDIADRGPILTVAVSIPAGTPDSRVRPPVQALAATAGLSLRRVAAIELQSLWTELPLDHLVENQSALASTARWFGQLAGSQPATTIHAEVELADGRRLDQDDLAKLFSRLSGLEVRRAVARGRASVVAVEAPEWSLEAAAWLSEVATSCAILLGEHGNARVEVALQSPAP